MASRKHMRATLKYNLEVAMERRQEYDRDDKGRGWEEVDEY